MKPKKPKPTLDEYLEGEQKKTLELMEHGKLPRAAQPPAFVSMWLPPPK